MKKILETLQRKWAEYLLEMIVITFGILGAFILNNWNENRQERIKEQLFLTKISLNLTDDISNYSFILKRQGMYQNAIDSFLFIVKNPTVYSVNDLDKYRFEIWKFERFTPIKTAFENLKSSGEINIIQSDSIQDQLFEYYRDIESQTNGIDAAIASYSRDHFGPFFIEFDFWEPEETQSIRNRKSLIDYYKEPQVENLLRTRSNMTKIQKQYYNAQVKQAQEIIDLIKNELK